MNIFRHITLRTLTKNKTRTVVTIIGIILSAAMITAVTSFISSLQKYMFSVAVYNTGEWHAMAKSVDAREADKLRSDPKIRHVFAAQDIGYAQLRDNNNKDKPYLFVMGVDDAFMNSMPVRLIKGRLPENRSEILLPKHLQTNGAVAYGLGDTVSLELGERISEGVKLDQLSSYLDGSSGRNEELTARENRTYTVVGFYERPEFEPYSAPGYTALTIKDNDAGNIYGFDVYFEMSDPKNAYTYGAQLSNDSGHVVLYNSDVLMYVGASRYSSFYTVFYSLGAILIALIMLGSVSLIYNAFAISVSERTKQFGLLSSAGATKKQIRRSVLFEALAVSGIGIPVGILSGLAGIGITLACIGDVFSSIFQGGTPISITLNVSFLSVAMAAVIALATVLISAWIPSRRAAGITAIEAIRQTGDIYAKAKEVKTSKLTYRLFGLEGVLAKKHFRRNRKRYRSTVVSLFISLVLFISASSFCAYLKDGVENVFDTRNYDLSFGLDTNVLTGMTISDLYGMLKDVTGVTGSDYAYSKFCNMDVPAEYLDSGYIARSTDEAGNIVLGGAMFFAVDNMTYIKYLSDNGLDPTLYMDKNAPLAIITSYSQGFNYDAQKYETYDVFNDHVKGLDLLIFDEASYNELTDKEKEQITDTSDFIVPVPIKVGYVADDLPIGISANYSGADVTVMYPESMTGYISGYLESSYATFYFTSADHKATFDKMANIISEAGLDNTYLYDNAASGDTNRNLVVIINVFSYGFIILISLIAAANVFNTISTNINLRRREFAMLRSVGMTKKGFARMMDYECLLYGIKSLIWGLPASAAVTYLIYKSIREGFTASFYIPWLSVIIAVFSVFAVVFAAMMYSMDKIKKDNPIDALRNENL
jgi:putative ABC transport system permease protein